MTNNFYVFLWSHLKKCLNSLESHKISKRDRMTSISLYLYINTEYNFYNFTLFLPIFTKTYSSIYIYNYRIVCHLSLINKKTPYTNWKRTKKAVTNLKRGVIFLSQPSKMNANPLFIFWLVIWFLIKLYLCLLT